MEAYSFIFYDLHVVHQAIQIFIWFTKVFYMCLMGIMFDVGDKLGNDFMKDGHSSLWACI